MASLACLLGLLQGCRSGDAVAPVLSEPVVPSQVSAPRNIRVLGDTVVSGTSVVVSGEALPTTTAAVTASLNGVALPVKQLSSTIAEFIVPAAFPCGAASQAKLAVRFGAVSLERDVVLQTAVRVALAPGASRAFTDVGASLCVELAPQGMDDQGASDARFVLAVVNTKPFEAKSPIWSMRGMGVGAASNAVSVEQGGTVSRIMAPSPASLSGSLGELGAAAHLAELSMPSVLARTAITGRRSYAMKAAVATSVGDTVRYTAMSGSCQQGRAVRARTVYAGSQVVVLEDVSAASAGSMDAIYRQIGAEYEQVMHPLLLSHVGNPLAMAGKLGGDRRVVLLFTPFVNDSMPGTAAYVSACNLYPRGTFAASNEAAVVYGRVPARTETATEWRRAMRATVMHEAKHLASFAERLAAGRDFEEPWLEEATARVAEELYARTFTAGAVWRGNVGFAESVQCEVLQCDDRPLVMWKHYTGLHAWMRSASTVRVGQLTGENGVALNATAANAAYGSGWALVRWVLDNHVGNEPEGLRALVAGGSRTGMAALAASAGVTESALLAGWASSLAAESGSRVTPFSASPSTWSSADIIGGMASMFPGVFVAQPLAVVRRTVGSFDVNAMPLTGTASYLEVRGDFARGGQVVQFSPGAKGSVGLTVQRAQ